MQHHLNTAPRRERNKTFCYHKANYATTRHITPLSPWRGAGGEASCRAVCGVCVHADRITYTISKTPCPAPCLLRQPDFSRTR